MSRGRSESEQGRARDGRQGEVRPLSDGWRVRLFRGLRALEDGDTPGAIAHFEAALRLARRPEVCYALGREHARAGRFDEAEALFEEAWAQGTGLPVAAAALARLVGIARGRTEDGLCLLEQAVARFPHEPNLLIVRGELYLESDDPAAARTCFETALDRGGDAAAAQAGLARALNAEGVACGERGDDDRALFLFRRAAGLDAAWSGPHVNMGVVFARLGRQKRALAAYEQALRIDPENAVAHFNLGNLWRQAGNRASARAAYARALALDPEHRGVRGALADLLGEAGEFAAAVELLSQDVERDPASPRCWSNLGLAQACMGDDAAAERSLRRALEIDAGHATACVHLATLYARQGRYPDAAEMTRRAFELDPEQARAVLGEPPPPR